jgi:hypothetical protein
MPGGDEWEVEVLVENSPLVGGEEEAEVWREGLEMIVEGWVRRPVRVNLRDVQVEGPRRIGSGELWEDDRASLEEHETPKWWSEAKFGIFLHIGLYSVPAWVGPSLVLSVSLGMY